jgi:hypothetical protein
VRTIDWFCRSCGWEEPDAMADVEDHRPCPQCGQPAEQNWLPRVTHRPAQWDDNTAVMVHVHPATGDVRYVGRHDAKLKPGYERRYLRSLHEVDRFEREHHVANERMHFDQNGRGLGDQFGTH